jgi:hypothetical protein
MMNTTSQIIPPLPSHIPPERSWSYELILWRESMTNPQETVYRTLSFLADIDESLRAKYIYMKEFELSPKQIAKTIQKGASEMPDLGSNFTVTTTLDSLTYSYSFSVGISNPMFSNVFVMKIPRSKVEGNNSILTFDRVQFIFQGLVEVFDPFWGAISNNLNFQRFVKVSQQIDCFKIPSAIHWFNYFDRYVLERLNPDRVLSAPFHSVVKLKSQGVMAILQEEPFNDRDPDHLQRQYEVMEYLNFNELYCQYPRCR